MKLLLAIAKYTPILFIMTITLILNSHNQAQANRDKLFNWLKPQPLNKEQIVTIKELKPGKIQTISGTIEALCDDEFILRDDTSPIVVNVDLEANDIRLFQGEKVTVRGIYSQDELEAFQITRFNGEIIQLNSKNE